jgi:hypothetical protein
MQALIAKLRGALASQRMRGTAQGMRGQFIQPTLDVEHGMLGMRI